MPNQKLQLQMIVHCRIGSLESLDRLCSALGYVHCRIGSLEREACANCKQR